MDFEIDKKEFLKGLSLVQGIAGRKTTLPILTHVLMEAKKNSFLLTGTDLEIGIREELTAKVYQEGKTSVSAKKLYEIVRELPDESIHIQKKENQWIRIQCGKSIFNLSGLDPEEFPAVPTHNEADFSQISIYIFRLDFILPPITINSMIKIPIDKFYSIPDSILPTGLHFPANTHICIIANFYISFMHNIFIFRI